MEPTADCHVIVLSVCLVLKTLENVMADSAIQIGMVSIAKVHISFTFIIIVFIFA